MLSIAADDSVPEVVLVTQLPTTTSWFESTCARPNGKVLATRCDEPELYEFDPEQPDEPLRLVCTIPECSGLVNACALKDRGDEYAVLTAMVDLEAVSVADHVLWRVAFEGKGDGQPSVTKLAALPGMGMGTECTVVSERTLLISDTYKACIWALDLPTGKTSVFLKHETMVKACGDYFFGLNRIRIHGDHLWYANESTGSLCRVPIVKDDKADGGLRITGPVEIITDEIPNTDGLTMTEDGTTVYSVNYVKGTLRQVKIDPATGKAETREFMSSLIGPTTIELVRSLSTGKPKLVVICNGRSDVAWIKDFSWSDIANISASETVTVTTEEVV
ncbi:hypothetical protein DL766_007556 [Monosporascus sp. MC13-8B]|uniref:SMP-30/Gluconolactonase/LRE-like region domain-containing protein n=1 Tax=Monosporascus cannonballus TaxID=155416 RepID=A0ABY0HJM1_9PEZI|nr:hypothetical protein DL762_000230 [Monosporascus cannonballus]RYO99378.1 hypothetical protein DL763_001552 [Monosporascus cannonballus]RYP23139.1 hypothetical protein DL766_007556 [Monosporascus sp. MC13-8B]